MSVYVPLPARLPSGVSVEMKASPIGPGSGVLQTEFPLSTILGNSPQKRMAKAYQLAMNVPWIRKAEAVIGSRFATVDYDLDDPDGNEIEDDYPNPDAVLAFDLLAKPQANVPVGQKLSRTSLWRLTSRHTGVCGNAFWLLDQPELLGRTPAAIVYIRPDRMTPNEDANGNLRSWQLDKTPNNPGLELSLEQVVHFMLEPPDSGHFGPGLVESWLTRASMTQALDRHVLSVLDAGGRLSGIMSPKSGAITEPEQRNSLERDWRNVVEQTDAAKRLQVVYAPVEFTATTMTLADLRVIELMTLMRDDGLAFWGVPPTTAGIPAPSGLNSGDSRKYDEAALWQGPVHDRLVVLGEQIQDNILDRWESLLGWAPQLRLEEPEFDDDSPRYDLLGKSMNISLTNAERRDLIGKPPFGDPALDDAIWMPATIVAVAQAPDPNAAVTIAVPTTAQPVLGPAGTQEIAPALLEAGETSEGKATIHPPRLVNLRSSLLSLRDNLARHATPRIRAAVGDVLREQRADIAARLRRHADAITRKPADASVWFDAPRWDAAIHAAIRPHAVAMAEAVSAHVATVLPPVRPAGKAAPAGAVDAVLSRGAARVGGINEVTRAKIQDAIIRGLDAGLSVVEVADLIEGTAESDAIGLDLGAWFDESRAETIARTELMDAYNRAALGSYRDAEVRYVRAIDGDGDEECAARNDQVFLIDDADTIEDHPNGTLDWIPELGEEAA